LAAEQAHIYVYIAHTRARTHTHTHTHESLASGLSGIYDNLCSLPERECIELCRLAFLSCESPSVCQPLSAECPRKLPY
jgi:hypothetical protein